MENGILDRLTDVADASLLARVKTLVGRERDVVAELIAHLAEMDIREIHLREGYPSLYVYCRDALGLSEWEAYHRIDAARTVRRFPVILAMLAEGSVNLTAIRLLAPHLTAANHIHVLAQARGKRKAQVAEIVAALAPRPDVATTVRRVAAPAVMASVATEAMPGAEGLAPLAAPPAGNGPVPAGVPSTVAAAASGGTSLPAAAVVVLSPDRYKLQLTIAGETLEKLRLAQDMLGHALPEGECAAVVDRALTVLLTDLARKKFADTRKPRRAGETKPGARSPSAAVKRAVWMRDLGACAFIGTTGHRCNERRFVEFHHVDPHALGGEATVDGIQLRCRQHNAYEGRLYFGDRRRHGVLAPEQVRLNT